MKSILVLIPLVPLFGSLVSGLFGSKLSERFVHSLTIFCVFVSACLSAYVFYDVMQSNSYEFSLYTWANLGELKFEVGFLVDSLTASMMLVVNFVSLMVHIYTIGYMHGDPGYKRFFSFISLFTFAMLMLVMSNNFLQLFFGWEAVGLVSYLLIGFWFKKETAIYANLKAFLVNRVGDLGFLLGIGLLVSFTGSLNYLEIFASISKITGQEYILFDWWSVSLLTLTSICLFIGAMGKSAQILLHTWLPDAMEGPTPVSALIHAATMVTAGVFLVVRCSPIYEYSPLILNLITIVGMTTAFFAATVALVQTDIKKIIAYSTCSQLGYMFFAAGVGAYNVAMFHLFTHAFFKALLFLGSGSVIHAFKDEQNINNMGGVWKKLPYTYALMIIGTLALTGFPFLSGFYSKDAIIEFAYLKGNTTGYYAAGIGIFTAFLTSIYSWRLIFKTFHGKYNNKDIDIKETHDSPLVMLLPLVILAIGAIFAGYLFKDLFVGHGGDNYFWANSIKFLVPLSSEHPPMWFLLLTPCLVLLSIPIAYYLFVKNKELPNQIANINKPLYNFLINKWYFDELYEVIFIRPSKKIGLFLWKFCDVKLIDGFGPDGISLFIKKCSIKASKFQSGFIYQYAFIMLLGFSALLTFLIIR